MIFVPVLVINLILLVITILLAIADRLLVSYGECKITVHQEGESKEFTVDGGGFLLSDLTSHGISITSSCAGKASCGYCKVKVQEGGGQILPTEEIFMSREEKLAGMRLACQVKVKNDLDIFIPDFLAKISQGRKTQEVRVQECLFKHVGVEITKLGALGKHKAEDPDNENTRREIDELTIRCNAASQAMTKRFRDWWEQRTHAFHYELHGNYFRIWVSDDRNPSEIELEERSAGMRYFFSFYLVFIVEAEDLHRNCILLLDEPGLHLHGTAQAKLIEFLEKMSADNQLFYTTHSPFMIDGAHLERAVALSEEDGNMRVSTDVWPRDRDSLFPLQAALGYSVCQSLFVSKKQVMVEGMTDYALLSALNQQLIAGGKGGLDRAIVMVPMGGTTNLAPLASMLIGHDIEIAVLLDSDPAGAKGMAKMRKLLVDFDQRCFQISSYGGDHEIVELEDLLPEKYYLDAVKRAYPAVGIKFTATEMKIASIVDRLQQLFERLEAEPFEKWRPIHEVVKSVYSDPDSVPAELLDAAERIFKDINAALVGEV